MVEGNVPQEAWPVHNLQKLEIVVVAARNAGKNLFIWDKQGSVGTFMQYKGKLCSLAPEVIKEALKRQTKADVAEFIRKHYIAGMRNGDNLCLDMDTCTPDFGAMTTDGTFNGELFFNWQYMNERDNYMPFVRDDENHGIGGINPGFGYVRSDNFSMTIRSGAENEAAVNAQIAQIPNFYEQFQHVIFE